MPGQIPDCSYALVLAALHRAERDHAAAAAAADRARAEAAAVPSCGCHDAIAFGHGPGCQLGLGPAARGGTIRLAHDTDSASAEVFGRGAPRPPFAAVDKVSQWAARVDRAARRWER